MRWLEREVSTMRFVYALPIAFVLGCSTPSAPPSAVPPPVFFVQQVPPPEFERDLPLEMPQGHFCQLGKSCMELDPRPFETCLVGSAKRCADKITEPLLVGGPAEEPPGE
jgi:hypothetical protein